jgi:hypothetical protein
MEKQCMTKQKILATALAASLLAATPFAVARADNILNSVLKGAVGVFAVQAIAGPLDHFINSVMLANNVGNRDKTKVVPIVTVGSATYVGAAQVTGPSSAIDQVKAVGEFAANWNNGVWQVRALVPVDNLNVLHGFKRVYGVGIDAVINAKL